MTWFGKPLSPATEPFSAALRAAIERWPAPATAPGFVVALSGGVDSTVLLHGLHRLGLGARLRAAHVDHGLQPASAAWARHCEQTCAALGVELTLARVDVDRDSPLGLEAAAREARYAALAKLLSPNDVLLTAHHADDQLETLLLRLVRGTGVRGLRGIIGFGPFGPGFLGRPLLRFTRAELRDVALQWRLDWIEDPSNAETRHDRNFLRANVLPSLLERWPAVALNATRLAEQMAEAEALLEDVAAADAAVLDRPSCVPRAVLAALTPAHQRNLLRYLVRRAGLPVPSALKIDELRAALLETRRDSRPLVRWPGAEGRVFRGQLYLLAPLPTSDVHRERARLTLHGRWLGPEGQIDLVPAGDAPGLPESWLADGLTVRFRSGGERFRPYGRDHHWSLKHCFQSAGVVPWMRDRVPLLYHGDELVAVADLWIADAARSIDAAEPRWRVQWSGHPPIY